MKLYFLIKVLALHYIHASLSVDNLEAIQRLKIKSQEFVIRPEGPLTFLRSYIYRINGFVHNKRFFSPEIRTDYMLKKPYGSSYIFNRNEIKDCAYFAADTTDGADSYITQYHQTLIQMFPSENGDLSIETERQDSFIKLLRNDSEIEHANKILASLFLLSEGVHVPIHIMTIQRNEQTTKETLLEKTQGKSSAFSIVIQIPVDSIEKSRAEMATRFGALDVIEFFVHNHAKCIKDPATLEEFRKGDFLESKQFLIQAYLFEFLNTVQDVERFFNTVYAMLNNIISSKLDDKPRRKAAALFDKCFQRANSATKSTAYVQSLKESSIILQRFKLFPFMTSRQLPFYTTLPNYNRTLKEFSKNEYSENSMETALYALFCCLLYDPSTQKYSLHKMKDVSPEIKGFFAVYPEPVESTTFKIHKAWSAVVSDLKNIEIDYKKNRNELYSGMLNMLRVLFHVSGRFYQESAALSAFVKRLDEGRNFDKKFSDELTEYIENTFRSLRVCNRVQFICKDLNLEPRPDGRLDIGGKIIVEYTGNTSSTFTNYGIVLEFHGWHTTLSFLHNNIEISHKDIYKLINIRNTNVKKKTFTGFLVASYIEHIIGGASEMKNLSDLRQKIKEIAGRNTPSINEILLLKKIENPKYKRLLMGYSLCYAKEAGIAQSLNNALLRFAANIFGSMPFDHESTRNNFLGILALLSIYEDVFPNVVLSKDEYAKIISSVFVNFKSIDYILDTDSACVLAGLFKAIVKSTAEKGFFSSLVIFPSTLELTFSCLFKNNTAKYGRELLDVYQVVHKELGAEIAARIRFAWFVIACQKKKACLNLIKELYDSIETPLRIARKTHLELDQNEEYIMWIFYRFYQNNARSTLAAITHLKKDLTRESNDLSKFASIEEFFINIQS